MTAPVCVDDLRRLARARLPRHIWDYVAGGAGEERTVRANREAFRRLPLVPRVLVDVARRDLRTTALGTEVAAPIGIAPTSYHTLAHPDGELATARAAGSCGMLNIGSVFSSITLEDIATVATGPLWFQLYCLRDRGLTRGLVDRATAAGYRALVLGVDLPVIGYRDRDLRNRFRLPPGVGPVNLALGGDIELAELNRAMVSPTLTWRDVEWIRDVSELPIVLKGVTAPADAATAARIGVDGVLVSNHGGRQVDGALPSLAALPPVVDAVQNSCEVYLDSGVRRGSDALKAIARGARMVFLGRPVMWGLAAAGEEGVRAALSLCATELDLTMAACGCPDVASIGPHLLGVPDDNPVPPPVDAPQPGRAAGDGYREPVAGVGS